MSHEIPRHGWEHMLGLVIFILKSSPTYSRRGAGQRALSFHVHYISIHAAAATAAHYFYILSKCFKHGADPTVTLS